MHSQARWSARILLLGSLVLLPQLPAATMRCSLHVVDGEGAMNQVKKRAAQEPVVVVLDKDERPVAGATVKFSTPTTGPSASFVNGTPVLTVITDAKGRAIAKGLQANAETGVYQISVAADCGGWHATATIHQNNVYTASRAGVVVPAVVAGAAAAVGSSITVLASAGTAKTVVNGITVMDAGTAPTASSITFKPADVVVPPTSAPPQ